MKPIFPMLWSATDEQRLQKLARPRDRQRIDHRPPVMCKRCVITNKRPRIVFDADGVCSACRWAEEKDLIDWQRREHELSNLLMFSDPHEPYDVVVPASGGKDSSHVALTLRKEFGQRVILARWHPLVATEIGEQNWQSLIHAGFDALTAQPNGFLARKLARLGLEFYGDPFLPFIYGQLCWPFHVANQTGSRLVFFGENGEAEYGGDPAANNKSGWDESDWERIYMKGADVDQLLSIGEELGLIAKREAQAAAPFYRMPEREIGGPQFHWLSYYRRWRPQENFYRASTLAGFRPRSDRTLGTHSTYASLDDALDHLHYFMGYVKFGIGRCTSDCAHEIRDGELDRDDAISLVEQYDGEYPRQYLNVALEYLGMTEPRFQDVCRAFKAPWVELPF